eukprot:CAMPEP_0119353550 /NCGR_PEP_ID=MMETSP1334-20130426/2664_1 /TAXON_ID=127549 /ORGANISM="Calcidiscus leptoporus, Strain RCC1130" /LENGTH=31 /DNA_ID= /DNA_START= /DNA_END= /DNA_ORIENTATION=
MTGSDQPVINGTLEMGFASRARMRSFTAFST